ncbi:MAG: hypothetical protein IJ113_01885 [Eggerthellaceae bacterium]|nr:hypothetical protein [Eggerthellaceae bacterium]
MKRKLPFATIIAVMLCTMLLLVSCGTGGGGASSAGSSTADGSVQASEGEKVPAWPAQEALASLAVADINSIEYVRATEGGLAGDTLTGAEDIEDVYLRLKDLGIVAESNMGVDDDGLSIRVNTGAKTISFTFEGDILVLEDGSRFEVENLGSLKSYIDRLIEEQDAAMGSGDSADDMGEAISSPSEPADSSPETPSKNQGTTNNAAYDIEENFTKTASADGSIEYLYFNDFMMIMPGNEKWSFEADGDSVAFYLFSAQQEGFGGRLVSIVAYDIDDYSYENLPVEYHVAGVGQNVNKRFIAIYPSDVQFDPGDATQQADYKDLYDYLHKIGEGAVNSPFQVADSNPAP